MRSTDFATITSPAILGGIGRNRRMAHGGHAKAAPHPHRLVIVAPSPIMGALMAAMLLHQAGRGRQHRGALSAALAKRKRR